MLRFRLWAGIYRKAKYVLCWLGDTTGDDDLLLVRIGVSDSAYSGEAALSELKDRFRTLHNHCERESPSSGDIPRA